MEFSENVQKGFFILIVLSIFATLTRHLIMSTEESSLSKYLKNNYVYIFSFITFVVGLIVFFNIIGLDMKSDEETELQGKYIVEGYKSDLLPESFWKTKGKGFCQSVTNNSKTHINACSKLSFSNCSAFVDCCAAANGFDEKSYSCVPASASGRPLYNQDNYGKDIDFYWYKGKCKGDVCNYNSSQRNIYLKNRYKTVQNKKEDKEILNKVEKEQKKQDEGCASKEKTCYLWGVPDAQVSPFG